MLAEGQPTAFEIAEGKQRNLTFTACFPGAFPLQSLLDVDYESRGNRKLSVHFGERENISAHYLGKPFSSCSAEEPRSCDRLCC